MLRDPQQLKKGEEPKKSRGEGGRSQQDKMATKCSDPAVLAGLFLAAYSGNLADVKSVLKNNALSADVADPDKVGVGVMCSERALFFVPSRMLEERTNDSRKQAAFMDQCQAICRFFSPPCSPLACGNCCVQCEKRMPPRWPRLWRAARGSRVNVHARSVDSVLV